MDYVLGFLFSGLVTLFGGYGGQPSSVPPRPAVVVPTARKSLPSTTVPKRYVGPATGIVGGGIVKAPTVSDGGPTTTAPVNIGTALVVVNWDYTGPINVHKRNGGRLDITYINFPGTMLDAVHDCLNRGGEPIAPKNYTGKASDITCEDVDI